MLAASLGIVHLLNTWKTGQNIRSVFRYCTVVMRWTYIKVRMQWLQCLNVLYWCPEKRMSNLEKMLAASVGIVLLSWEELTSKSVETVRSVFRYWTVVMKGTYIKVWRKCSQRLLVLYCCHERNLHQIPVKMFAASVGIVLLSGEELTSKSGENVRSVCRYCTVVRRGTYIKVRWKCSQRL